MISLSAQQVVSPKEKNLFVCALVLAILGWVLLTALTCGFIWILMGILAIAVWFTNGLLIASLRSEAVAVHPRQVGRLDAAFLQVCATLGIKEPPEIYIMQSGGALNAFATRHTGRHFVVIYSDMLEAFGPDSAEMRFLLGHELGHISRNHVLWRLALAPALFLPIIGPAYSRACESTCDRYGALAAGDVGAAMRAMMLLAGGKEAGREMDVDHFAAQNHQKRGFFVSWYELISGYPTLSRRMNDLRVLRGEQPSPPLERNPLGFLFALFSCGGGFGGRGSMITTLIMIYFLAIFASLAMPALNGAFKKGRATAQISDMRQVALALQTASLDGQTLGDKSLGFPADAGITNVSELKEFLVKNRYITEADLEKLRVDGFDIGNVSSSDPNNTILIRSEQWIVRKDGNIVSIKNGVEIEEQDPPRSPAYLSR